MSIIAKIPSSTIHGEVRYLAYGDKMKKQHGNETYDWGIQPPPANGTAAEGSGGNVAAGTYQLHIVPESYLGRFGNPYEVDKSPVPISITIGSAGATIVVTLPIHGDPQVKYMNVYRTRVDELGPYYFGGRVANGVTSLILNGNDESLPIDDFLEGPTTYSHDVTNYAGPFKYGAPPAKKFCFLALDDRMFVAGETEYNDGTISMVSGSNVVYGVGTAWTDKMTDKTIRIADEGLRYEIETVDSATRLKIKTTYKRPTWKADDPSDEEYVLIGYPNNLFVSEPGEPEYFNPIAFDVGKEDGGYLTGGIALGRDAIVLTESQIFGIQAGYGISELEISKTASTYGTVSHRSVVDHRGSVFFFSGDYICQFYNQTSQPISLPLGDLLIDSVEEMKQFAICTIWEDYLLMAFAAESTEFLDTIVSCNLKTRIWDIWDNMRVIDMQTIVTEDGGQHVYFNSPAGNGYTLNTFQEFCLNDGMDTRDFSGNVTMSTPNSITVDTVLPESGAALLGLMVRIESGTGVGQQRYIYTNSDSTITVETPWDIQPDFSSTYSIGSIDTWFRSGKMSPDHEVRQQFKEVEMRLGEDDE